MAENTKFSAIYNRFLGKITDDMYMELTPQDTIRDLQNLLVDAIPGFEFPRKPLYDYTIKTEVIPEDQVQEGDFIIGVIWSSVLRHFTVCNLWLCAFLLFGRCTDNFLYTPIHTIKHCINKPTTQDHHIPHGFEHGNKHYD